MSETENRGESVSLGTTSDAPDVPSTSAGGGAARGDIAPPSQQLENMSLSDERKIPFPLPTSRQAFHKINPKEERAAPTNPFVATTRATRVMNETVDVPVPETFFIGSKFVDLRAVARRPTYFAIFDAFVDNHVAQYVSAATDSLQKKMPCWSPPLEPHLYIQRLEQEVCMLSIEFYGVFKAMIIYNMLPWTVRQNIIKALGQDCLNEARVVHTFCVQQARTTDYDATAQLMTIKQRKDESLDDFCNEIRRLGFIAFRDPEERNSRMVVAFLSGLHNRSAAKLMAGNIQLVTLTDYSTHYNVICQKFPQLCAAQYKSKHKSDDDSRDTTQSSVNAVNSRKSQGGNRGWNKNKNRQANQKDTNSEQGTTNKSKFFCVFCNKPGHTYFRCFARKKLEKRLNKAKELATNKSQAPSEPSNTTGAEETASPRPQTP